jgi:hypothetical protein
MVILISLDSRRRYVSLSFIFDTENKIKNQTLSRCILGLPGRIIPFRWLLVMAQYIFHGLYSSTYHII